MRWGPWVKLALLAVWLAAVATNAWAPWQEGAFRQPAGGVAAHIRASLRVPLFDIVRRLDFLEGIARLARAAGAMLVCGMLLQSLLARAGRGDSSPSRWRRILAAAFSGAVALALEFGRVFFPGYPPDATLALVSVAGGIAGLWAYPFFVRVFLEPSAGGGF